MDELPTREAIDYVSRFGGFCRDCADEDGVCPTKGLPCDLALRSKAISHVIAALEYGAANGHLALSTPIGEPAVATVSRAIHEHLSRRDIMQYLDNDEDCEGLARAAIAAMPQPAIEQAVADEREEKWANVEKVFRQWEREETEAINVIEAVAAALSPATSAVEGERK